MSEQACAQTGLTTCYTTPYSLKSRIGGGKAAPVIGHNQLICIWNMLTNGEFYRDLGEQDLDRRNEQQTLKRYARKLEALGYAIVPMQQEAGAMAASSQHQRQGRLR